jgi:adenylate kinase family enzyme
MMTRSTPQHVTNVIVTGKSGAGKQPRIDVLLKEYNLEQLSTGNIFRHFLGRFNEYSYKGPLDQFWNEAEESFVSDDIIASEIGTDDEDIILGLKAKYFVERGLFGPDNIVNALFESAFSKKNYRGQVLDGYPRTIDQSRFLIKLLKNHNSTVDFILWVENSDERIIKRTTNRRICPRCGKVYHLLYKPPKNGNCEKCGVPVIQRSDDTEEKIKSRLQEFHTKTIPAIQHLIDHGISCAKVSGHLETFTEEAVKQSVMDAIASLDE